MQNSNAVDWRLTTLGEVFKQRTERGTNRDPLLSVLAGRGVVPQTQSGRRDVSNDDKSMYRRVHPGDIVYNTMRMWQGVSAISPLFGIVSPAYTVCQPAIGVDGRFLAHVLQLPEKIAAFRVRSQGLVSDTWNLKYAAFETVPVAIPPLREQQRIAEVLDSMDESIRAIERVIAKLEKARNGLFFSLFPPDVIRPLLNSCEEDNSSALPEWRVATCDDLCREIIVGIVVKPAQYYVSAGVPVLRSLNVREGRVDLHNVRYMTSGSHSVLSKSAVSPGDVLTVRTGSPGTSAVVPLSLPSANCVDVIISRPGQEIDSEYLALWINSPFGKDQVLSGQAGLAQQHFNVGEMKKLRVVFPDRDRQRSIVAANQSYSSMVEANKRQLLKERSVRFGLGEDLLTGRVRVEDGET